MKSLTLPVVSKKYISKIEKTAVEVDLYGELKSVFVNGNQADNPALLVQIVVNEVGDTFKATKDSSTLHADGPNKGKPLYLKGETVIRKVQSLEFKSFTGKGTATEFAQSAAAFGLVLNVVMSA